MNPKLFAALILVATALISPQPACTPEQGVEAKTVAVDVGLCILQHLGEPAPQIARDCLGAEAACLAVPDTCPEVGKVLAFQDGFRAAMVRASAMPDGGAQ